jgi:hypothetical protein
MVRQSPAWASRGPGLSAQAAPKHATYPKDATAAIYWYHDPLAKLCEKTPRTYRTRAHGMSEKELRARIDWVIAAEERTM